MYCCFKRAPSFPWSMLKEIAAAASPVENIFTGTEPRPNDRVADPMECALMVLACAREGPMIRLHPYGRKTEARSRSARDLPRQAVAGPHAGARCGRRRCDPLRRGPVRGPHARGAPAALGPAARNGPRAAVMGRSQGPVPEQIGRAHV